MNRYTIVALMFLSALLSADKVWGIGWTDKWSVESESTQWSVKPLGGDTLEITSPMGLTLWYKRPFRGDATVEYDAAVMYEGFSGDRLSDMNLFWMASDPCAKTIWDRMGQRNGNFKKCSQLQLYYFGYGGNSNRTTRFRRYDGNPDPKLLKEYTDTAHLLLPNRWYHVEIESRGKYIRIYVNKELLVDFCDEHPLRRGWFGFRTTHSRTRIANFRYRLTSKTNISR